MPSEKAAQLRNLLVVAKMLRQAAIDDAQAAPLFRAAAEALENSARREAFGLPSETRDVVPHPCNIVC
jgi:hypothetical protein